MKKKTIFISGLTILSVLCLTFSQCTQAPKDVSGEITEVNKQFIEAFDKGDAKTLATNYTVNAKLYPSNSDIIEGPASIEGFWNGVMKMGIKKAQLETVTAEAIGNVAIEEGKYRLFVEGDHLVDQGKYIVTWEKVNGQWKISKDIWNTNNPAPQVRATENGTVWIIKNCVKADKVAQYEEFNLNYLKKAAEEQFQPGMQTVRFLKPTAPNKDGTFNYFYVMDPAMKDMNYDMAPILTAKYGKEKADEYLKMYNECLKGYEMSVATQTGW
jgi:ketosteroid isomerase-like protein